MGRLLDPLNYSRLANSLLTDRKETKDSLLPSSQFSSAFGIKCVISHYIVLFSQFERVGGRTFLPSVLLITIAKGTALVSFANG